MKTESEIPAYDDSITLAWDDGFEIAVIGDESGVCIRANPAGLISLARHLLTLAQEGVPAGSHIHLDEYNSLEDGSAELVIARM